MTIPPPSDDPEISLLFDSLRAAGIPEDQLLPQFLARLAVANAVSAEPDWVTHCETCSVLHEGTLDVCPENVRHSVRTFDANSSAFRAYVAGRRGTITEIDLGMTNADGSIDDGLAEALKAGGVYGHHHGWNFCGDVWWDGTAFVEQVWHHRRPVATYRAATLPELMQLVNAEWGER